ncbi:MAG: hypothetical protein SVV03_00275 [Candidatus Nanohaloarchaea archaeon]|nr:hypothetical protein [Candidatus Nanohaloarchaea archaeon]
MVKCRKCGKKFKGIKSLRAHYLGSKDHSYSKEKFKEEYSDGEKEEASGGASEGKELEEKLDNLEDQIGDVKEKLQSLEDRELLNELEELGLSDQIAAIEDALGVRDPEKQKEKLEKLGELVKQWEKLKIPEKVNWLYKKYRELEERVEELE